MKISTWSALAAAALAVSALPAWSQDADGYVPPETYAAPDPVVETVDTGWDYDWGGSYLGVSAALAMGAHDTVGVGGISASSDDLTGTRIGGFLGRNYHISEIAFDTPMDFTKSNISCDFGLPGSFVACGTVGFSYDTNIG